MKLFILLFGFTLPAFAATNYTHTCQLDDDFDDWSVRVGADKADFFDNDHNCILQHLSTKKGVEEFGKGDEGCEPNKITFSFNKEELKATLGIKPGIKVGKKTKTKLSMSCTEGAYQDK